MEAAQPPPYLYAAGAVWPLLCAAVVSLRFYARHVLGARLLSDDWLTIPALVLVYGMGVALIVGVALKSVGYPTPAPPPGTASASNGAFEIVTTRSILWAFELMQIAMLGAVKLSFVMFYRRIFCSSGGSRTFRFVTLAVFVAIIVWSIALWLALFFICGVDFSAWWRSVAANKAYCPGTLMFQQAFAISDTLTDIVIFVLPIQPICKLHMSTGRKIAMVAIFSIGSLTIAASVTRMVIFIKAAQVDFTAHQDNDLLITGALYWSMNESGAALVASCLPTIYGLFRAKATRGRSNRVQGSYPTAFHSRSARPTVISFTNRTNKRAGSTASDIQMVDYTVSSGVSESHAMRTDKDDSSEMDQDQIRVIRDVYIESRGRV